MLARMGSLVRWLAPLVCLGSLAPLGPARAELSEPGFEIPEVSAWTLRAGELAIGPLGVSLGLFEVMQFGTDPTLDVLGAPNALGKWTIHAGARLGIGVEAGVIRFDPGLVGITDTTFAAWAFPVAFRLSGRVSDSVRVHGAVEFLASHPDGHAPDGVLAMARLVGPVGQLAAKVGFEWRANQHLALIVQLETPLIVHRAAWRYAGESDDAVAYLRGTASLFGTFGGFNFRIGGGWGPSFLGKAGPFPLLEFYGRLF